MDMVDFCRPGHICMYVYVLYVVIFIFNTCSVILYADFQVRCPVIYSACTYTAMHFECS